MLSSILACGPYFPPDGKAASLVTFLVLQPLAYFAFVRAFRYRANGAIPMQIGQSVKLAATRAILGLVLVGGAAFALTQMGTSAAAFGAWVYMFVARIFAWWIIGAAMASLRGRRLLGWIAGGIVLNVAFDVATVAGFFGGFTGAALAVLVIGGFLIVLELTGSRDSLRARFAGNVHWVDGEPICVTCMYNLTGNLSGVCPECGTPIATTSWGGQQAHPEHA